MSRLMIQIGSLLGSFSISRDRHASASSRVANRKLQAVLLT